MNCITEAPIHAFCEPQTISRLQEMVMMDIRLQADNTFTAIDFWHVGLAQATYVATYS